MTAVRVLVTDAGRGSAISVIRSLAARGWEVTAADDDPYSPGFYSRHTAHRLRYPAPIQHPDEAAAAIARAVERLAIDLVVPVTDELILPLSAIRLDLSGKTGLALPDDRSIALAADKVATLRLAERLGIDTPRSVVVGHPSDLPSVGDRLGWPVVVKPARSRTRDTSGAIRRHSVSYAVDAAELGRIAGAATGPLLVQEYLTGIGQGVELLLRDGDPIAAFQHRRIREVPVTGGASAFRESVPLDPELFRRSVALLAEMGWTGLAMVEFRVGPRGAALMEINGRIWGSLPLAVRAGVDFPGLMADVHLGRSTAAAPPIGCYRLGVTSRSLPLEVSWIGSVLAGRSRYPFIDVPPRRAGIAAALRLVADDGWDVQSRDDPLPGLVEIQRLAARTVRRLAPRSGGARS